MLRGQHPCADVAQTFTDYELILVDDGSPDNSGAICDEYAARDARVRVIHKENNGPSSARNAGLKDARGEFIYFLDSYDFVETKLLEIAISGIQGYDMSSFVFRAADGKKTTHWVCRYRHGQYLWQSETEQFGFLMIFFRMGVQIDRHIIGRMMKLAKAIVKHLNAQPEFSRVKA